MITDTQRDAALLRYHKRGINKEEVRSYEVSLWTLLDEFITVLKWSDVEQKGRIENPKMTLNVDGTQNLTFEIPMYLTYWNENANYAARLQKKENPIWYNTRNGNLIEGMRKIKVIFNKGTTDEQTFEFVIIKVIEKHESDIATCEVECEGLAFHELGKIGYKISLSQDNFELDYKAWVDGGMVGTEPIQNLLYWCQEAGLTEWPASGIVNARTWYYYVDMDWSSFAFSTNIARDRHKVYEEPFTSAWTNELVPKQILQYKEKARPVESSQSNLYNITQTIAELFGVHCRYEYGHDENYQITSRTVVFYNNFNKENEGVLGFNYPYSAKSVQRDVDTADLTTKLFIEPIDSENELEGVITIMNSEANKLKEDYILNFDYIHKIGGITDEQYDAIPIYEKNIRLVNEELIPVQLDLEAYARKKIEAEAKVTTYKNSIDLDKELINYNQELVTSILNSGDVSGQENDGYIHITGKSPDNAIIITTDEGKNYVNLLNTKKGIDVNSIKVYRSWISGEGRCDNEVSGWKAVYDEKYGNVIRLEKIAPTENSKTVYLTYRYKPELYYENIIKVWKIKLANDDKNWKDNQALVTKLESYISTAEATRDRLLNQKKQLIVEFERMMGAALREGYWQPEDYKDHGEVRTGEKTFTNSQVLNPFTTTSEEDFVIGWDPLLFDGEDKINYEVGVNLNLTYYPCINLSSIFANNPYDIRNHINEYSFIFNTNYYDENADLTNIKYTRSFSIGSEALLKFVKNPEGTIFPVLVLVGAKTMSDGSNNSFNEIAFMKAQNNGHPRLGIINSTVNSTNVSTVISNVIQVHDTSYWTFGSSQIEACEIVYPRINFNNASVKADTTNLYIAYNGALLTAYENYLILTRITEYGTLENPNDHPEYYITLKPETMWRCGTYTGKVKINYVISNLATGIYVDGLEIAKKNSEPKVEYNLEANIINEDLLHTLYKNLARIIMITDNDLKLEDAYGYISNIELDLDNPVNDSIEIKNYTSKFEDLFSTIVASTESLQRESNGIASAVGGNIGLTAQGFSATLLLNTDLLDSYLDTYFTNSPTVEQSLESLFTEAGQILGDSKLTLGNGVALSQENANILSNFANTIVQELSPKVTRGTTLPVDFKVGDVFIETDNQGNEIGRYVATSDSLHSVAPYGFTRTYDGSLAQITGASLDVDAENGTVNILAANEIFMGSGGNIKLHADEVVEIVGNKCVNIGGTLINLGSTQIAGLNVLGGINIVATAYTNESGPIATGFADAHTSKVLINPYEITMAGSKINMYTGTGSNAASAIIIDGTTGTGAPSYGIWLGSNKGIRLYSGSGDTNANVEINPTHIFFGMNNTNNGNATAAELTEKHIIFAAGNTLSDLDGDNENITINNNISGVKITKDKIGLATGSGANRAAIIMDSSGVIIGLAGVTSGNLVVDALTNGSYVAISGAGVTIGSKGKLNIDTTNFLIKSDAALTADVEMFRLGTTSEYALLYKKGVLTIRGSLLVLESGTSSSLSDWVNAKVTPTLIWLGVKRATDLNDSAHTEAASYLEITDSSFKIKSSGIFSVDATNVKIKTDAGNNESIFRLTDGAATNPVNYFNIAKNSSGGLFALLGGWLIEANKLSSGATDTLYVALDSNTSDPYAMWAGKINPDDSFTGGTVTVDGSTYRVVSSRGAPFRVTRNGRVYMDYLMLWDSENNCYKEVDFSDFNLAVSISGKWDGATYKATASFWGKFTKSASTSVSLGGIDLTGIAPTGGQRWSGLAQVLVNASGGATILDETITGYVDVGPAIELGWSEAASAQSPSIDGKKVTGLITSTYNNTGGTFDVSEVYDAGVESVKLGSRSVSYTSNGTYTVNPSTGYDGISSVSVTVNVSSGTSGDDNGGGTGGCFIAGTPVELIDGSTIPIEQLTVGTHVLAYDINTNSYVDAEILEIKAYKHKSHIVDIHLSSGDIITATESHPFLTTNGWSAIDPDASKAELHYVDPEILKENDQLVNNLELDIYITKIIPRKDLIDETVYNCLVETFNTYIVNHIVVHNAKVNT